MPLELQFLRRKRKDCAPLHLEPRRDYWRNGWYVACSEQMKPESRKAPVRPVAANVLSTAEVRSPAGEHVGKLVDFMLDTERGSVVYAVLAVGGVLGVGAKMLAVQPGELRFDARRRCLEIAVDSATLAAVPGIDRANPPETADAAVRSRASSRRPQSAPRGES
jgi:hypothetical protein